MSCRPRADFGNGETASAGEQELRNGDGREANRGIQWDNHHIASKAHTLFLPGGSLRSVERIIEWFPFWRFAGKYFESLHELISLQNSYLTACTVEPPVHLGVTMVPYPENQRKAEDFYSQTTGPLGKDVAETVFTDVY